MGIILLLLSHVIGGGGGRTVSSPLGASGGTVARCGYRSRRIFRTGRLKSMKASSIEAFSLMWVSYGVRLQSGGGRTYFTLGKAFFKYCNNLSTLSSIMIQRNLEKRDDGA